MKIGYKNLCAVLEEILQDADTRVFKNSDQEIDKVSLFELYAGDDWLELNLREYSVQVSKAALQNNRAFFENFFKPFVDKSTGQMEISSILFGSTRNLKLSALDFVEGYVIRAAVFLGCERVSRLLVDWKSGIPLKFTLKYQLQGLTLKSPLPVTDDLKILPSDRKNFDNKLSSWSKSGLESDIGALAFLESQTDAVFLKPGTSSRNLFEERHHKVRDFIDCLSLVLYSHVSVNKWWQFNKELQPFAPKNTISSFGTIQSTSIQWICRRQKLLNLWHWYQILLVYAQMIGGWKWQWNVL